MRFIEFAICISSCSIFLDGGKAVSGKQAWTYAIIKTLSCKIVFIFACVSFVAYFTDYFGIQIYNFICLFLVNRCLSSFPYYAVHSN